MIQTPQLGGFNLVFKAFFTQKSWWILKYFLKL